MNFEISPGDTLELSDRYNTYELNWFIKKLSKQFSINKIVKNMNKINDAIVVRGTGTKKGNVVYSRWRNKQLSYIEELNEDDNVFSRLKKSRKKNTLFDKLKFHSK